MSSINPITGGLYSTQLRVTPAAIYGQELWLEIKVRESGTITWDTSSPRVEGLPTVYALSLRPEARVRDSVDVPNAIVMVTNTPSRWGLRSESRDRSGYGSMSTTEAPIQGPTVAASSHGDGATSHLSYAIS